MTNFEHLIETEKLGEFISNLICNFPEVVVDKYNIQRNSDQSYPRAIALWLQAEYKPLKEYVAVEDIKKFFDDPLIFVLDHTDSVKEIGAKEIINRLHTITEDEIKQSNVDS